jgi:hypothetical protein
MWTGNYRVSKQLGISQPYRPPRPVTKIALCLFTVYEECLFFAHVLRPAGLSFSLRTPYFYCKAVLVQLAMDRMSRGRICLQIRLSFPTSHHISMIICFCLSHLLYDRPEHYHNLNIFFYSFPFYYTICTSTLSIMIGD